MSDPTSELFGKVICAYTRAQAIEDGVLVDVSEKARIAGFKFHAVVTASLWEALNDIPETEATPDLEFKTRLMQVLFSAAEALRSDAFDDDRADFTIPSFSQLGERTYRVHIGPGDEGQPVITIGEPIDF